MRRRIGRDATPGHQFRRASTLGVVTACLAALLAVSGRTGDVGSAEPDPLSVVQALVDAERAANLEAAIALFADDAFILTVAGWTTADRNELKWFINTEIWMRDDFRLHNPQVVGDRVSWTEFSIAPFYQTIGVAPVDFAFEAFIQRGKIKSIVAHLPVGEIARIREACNARADPLIHGRPCSEFVQLAEAHTKRHSQQHPLRPHT